MRPEDGRYRPDIDGLRAMAVLLVVAFHAFPDSVPGGFVGVDVFFVISGFLITGIIQRGLDEDRFSVLQFYARRIRRIFPALILVLLAVMAAEWFIDFPVVYEDMLRNVLAATGFVSNLYLAHSSADSYFAAVQLRDNPLTHLWSLGVEEQFYLLWPMLLIGLWKLRQRPALVILAIGTISFGANVWLVDRDQLADFYMPFTRFWELLLGAGLSMARNGNRSAPQMGPWQGVASVLGIGLILIAAAVCRPTSAFPGWLALLPTLGAVLVIAAGPGAAVNRALSLRWPVYIGLISYPLYLWHWPILVLVDQVLAEAPPAIARHKHEIAIIGSFAAAVLTYRFAEQPFQNRILLPAARHLLVGMATLAVVGCTFLIFHVVDVRFDPDGLAVLRQAQAESATMPIRFRLGRCFLDDKQGGEAFSEECRARTRPSIFLWGDSHAAHLYSGLTGIVPKASISQFTSSACIPVFGIFEPNRPLCRKVNDWVLQEIRREKPAVLIMAANWPSYAGFSPFARLRDTISLVKPFVGKIILVCPVPTMMMAQSESWYSNREMLFPLSKTINGTAFFDDKLRIISSEMGALYASPIRDICGTGYCPFFIPKEGQGDLFAFDDGHLTAAGSSFYARTLLAPALGLTSVATNKNGAQAGGSS